MITMREGTLERLKQFNDGGDAKLTLPNSDGIGTLEANVWGRDTTLYYYYFKDFELVQLLSDLWVDGNAYDVRRIRRIEAKALDVLYFVFETAVPVTLVTNELEAGDILTAYNHTRKGVLLNDQYTSKSSS
jgi:hypothetical protein